MKTEQQISLLNYQLVNWWKPEENSILFLNIFYYCNLFSAIEITWKNILKPFFCRYFVGSQKLNILSEVNNLRFGEELL